jgi:hypothetical protein
MPLPTFIVVGAQKCGTSTLAATLRRHPQVHMSRPKELHFFDRQTDRGLDWYAAQFKPKAGQVAIGEATPVYMYEAESRERIAASLPEAKLVVILRDPVKRAYSHFWHSKRLEFEDVDTFEEALAREPERLAGGVRSDRVRFSYVDRGHYLPQIQALNTAQGEHNVHVMLLEELRTAREEQLAGLFAFLGIDTSHASTIEEQWTNRYRVAETPGEKPKVVEYPPMAEETRARLAQHFRAPNDALAAFLGRELSGWTRE